MDSNLIDIYVMESDELFLKIIVRTLKGIKHNTKINIHTYTDGYEFIDSVKERRNPSIYFVSDVLPKKNGIEVAKHIRTFDDKSIIYFFTRAETEEDMVYALNMGVDNYFIKPFNLKIFQTLIKNKIIRGEFL